MRSQLNLGIRVCPDHYLRTPNADRLLAVIEMRFEVSGVAPPTSV